MNSIFKSKLNLKDLFAGKKPDILSSANSLYKSPASNPAQPAPTEAPAASKPAISSAPVSSPTTGATPPSGIPKEWIRPDGGIYTPDEMAEIIVKTAPRNQGDIGDYAGRQFGAPMSSEELQKTIRGMNRARGDLASGEKDPYGIASESGVQYSPSELSAIEKAFSGIYDPAIESAMTKLAAAQKAEKEEEGGGPVDETAVSAWADLISKKGASIDNAPQALRSAIAQRLAGTPSVSDSYKAERYTRAFNTIKGIKDDVTKAVTGIRGDINRTIVGRILFGNEATDFQSVVDTLEAQIIGPELQAMRDASQTGGALGQVSDYENRILASAMGSLHTKQSAAQFLEQLNIIEQSLKRWQDAQKLYGGAPSSGSTSSTTTTPSGGGLIETSVGVINPNF